jgi:hypothetical protein
MIEGPPGLAIDAAHDIIRAHALGNRCLACRSDWCPSAEWALWVCVTDQVPPVDGEHLVTLVARRVLIAHRPRTVDGCHPCGFADCDRYRTAALWLDTIGDPYTPTGTPPPDEVLRRIPGTSCDPTEHK